MPSESVPAPDETEVFRIQRRPKSGRGQWRTIAPGWLRHIGHVDGWKLAVDGFRQKEKHSEFRLQQSTVEWETIE